MSTIINGLKLKMVCYRTKPINFALSKGLNIFFIKKDKLKASKLF